MHLIQLLKEMFPQLDDQDLVKITKLLAEATDRLDGIQPFIRMDPRNDDQFSAEALNELAAMVERRRRPISLVAYLRDGDWLDDPSIVRRIPSTDDFSVPQSYQNPFNEGPRHIIKRNENYDPSKLEKALPLLVSGEPKRKDKYDLLSDIMPGMHSPLDP